MIAQGVKQEGRDTDAYGTLDTMDTDAYETLDTMDTMDISDQGQDLATKVTAAAQPQHSHGTATAKSQYSIVKP